MKKSGVILVNLGTPESTTVADVRLFLRQFLSDPRVIDLPRLLWWPVLHGVILPFRAKKSAQMYAQIWDEARFGGSPLLYYTKQQTENLGQRLPDTLVRYAMSYSQPTIETVLQEMIAAQVTELTLIPMYPQFSGTTVGSVMDTVMAFFRGKAHLPNLHLISDFYDDPGYIQVLADSIQTVLDAHPDIQQVLFSYHGVPKRYIDQLQDPYYDQCHVTTELTMERLDHAVPYQMTFQSKFGSGQWLTPATIDTIQALPQAGITNVAVVTPSFTADCLETLYEIGHENQRVFKANGGTNFTLIPPLNDQDAFIDFLAELVRKNSTA
ncbi:ferrochelatase [Agrilactobacillus fermenti]|uniref:ferrochelatase n=1 Tax=Agrilactobacillus fermenti TaxID=2586909 RepID=UPI001E380C74|nr:ferrochelatase [Agrilactobacillus fermenti]MCD2255528.1 ferrochelatase [Agrilactobacillus fermenti]